MKKQTRGFLSFVALGCVTAGAVGWGVWANSAPEETRVSSESPQSRVEKSAFETSPSRVTTSSSSTTPLAPAGDGSNRPQQQAPVSESDPYLAPNAFIPTGPIAVAPPTRVYSPSTSVSGATSEASTPSAQPQKDSQQPTSRRVSEDQNQEESGLTVTDPTIVSPSQPTTEQAEPSPAPPTTPLPEPTPTDDQVSPPTLVQPVPSTETSTTSPNEPTPIEPPSEPVATGSASVGGSAVPFREAETAASSSAE